MFESIKILEIKTTILFDLDFTNNIILLCLFFLFIDLYFLIHAAIVHIFNPIAELIISIGVPSKEAKAEIEIYPVIVEVKIRTCSI